MMIDIDAFLPKVLPNAPGCPEPVAFEHIRNAASELCEETKLWRAEDSFNVGEDPNVICVPSGAVLHQIERCDFDGRMLQPRGIGWLDEHYPDWRSDSPSSGAPSYFTQIQLDTVRVVPAQPGRLKLWARLKPSSDADQLPRFLFDQFGTLIGYGALAGILMLPGQPFSDPNRGAYFQSLFNQGLGRKSKLQATGQQRAPIRTRAQFF